jgi:hypothetical protein
MSMETSTLEHRVVKTTEDLHVDPSDSENNSLYDEDEKQLVSPPNNQRQVDFLPS